MNRNVLYLIIGALIVIAAVVGYQLYKEKESAVDIKIGALELVDTQLVA